MNIDQAKDDAVRLLDENPDAVVHFTILGTGLMPHKCRWLDAHMGLFELTGPDSPKGFLSLSDVRNVRHAVTDQHAVTQE